jgi:predicted TIM-barrel fold metal-dependent hydrolase
MVHTGMIQGTGSQRLDYNRPVPYLDDLAADFPDLTIVGCHPSFPWQDEMLAVATHKTNVFIELSAGWPEHFSDNLIRYINTFLQDKVMFGSGYPLFEPEEWIAQFSARVVDQGVQRKVLLENAMSLFGLDRSRVGT